MLNVKNKKILSISIIATLIVGSSIYYLTKKAATYSNREKVYVAKTTITKGSPIKSSNFKLVDRDASIVTSDIATQKDKLKDTVAKETIYDGEMLNMKRVISKTDPLAATLQLKTGDVEFSINVQSLDNYAGTYRAGDVVDIAFTPAPTNQNPTPQADILVKHAKVLGAIDSSGKYLSSGDKNVLATGISFSGSEDDFKNIAERQDRGKFKIAKVNQN